jgi:hypothetical protein
MQIDPVGLTFVFLGVWIRGVTGLEETHVDDSTA